MDEIYKILIAAAVGFALSPLNDGLKNAITTRRSYKKLTSKLITSNRTLKNSIRDLHNNAQKREDYIRTPKAPDNGIVFITPNLRLPDIEKEIEEAYNRLSDDQKSLIIILSGAKQHITKLLNKIENQEEDLRDFLHQKYQIKQEPYNSETERKEANTFYKRILSCEKAIIFTACTAYSTIEKILNNKPQLATNHQMLTKISEELGIRLRMDWWPYVEPEFSPDMSTFEDYDPQ
ncbi:hypothetical protein K1T36_06280 [Pseudomonas protegens]|uniref:hypothetical protein n=1 Tax=Pseudomonas protegens TaxID=380021 RepID=UPI001C69D0CA|nr:hypothetical protein [Pseudomonas protegens]QYN02760.1 hypothetical protein K1T36_06280 [Pseudomonas protegens]